MTHGSLPMLPVGCDIRRIEPEGNSISHPYRLDSQPYKFLENIVIPVQNGCDHPFVLTAGAMMKIMMPVTAFITAELLVLSSIYDFISALKTALRFVFLSVSVVHDNKFNTANFFIPDIPRKPRSEIFSFSEKNNFSFLGSEKVK